MTSRRWLGTGLLVAMTALTGACSSDGFNETFGFGRNTPDEFAVVPRAPLTVPPGIALPQPTAGIQTFGIGSASERGETVVFGDREVVAFSDGEVEEIDEVTVIQEQVVSISPGESALLSQAGAGNVQPGIRVVVEEETRDLVVADDRFIDSIIFWQTQPEPGTVIDPEAEARRLAANQALGQPLNEGEVPIIRRRRLAPFEGLF
ncbi:MAG: DUF3035 domain-containing protein [Pseudomonadota bacterium]